MLVSSSWENKGNCNLEAFPKWHPRKLLTIWLLLLFIRVSYSFKGPNVEGEVLIEFLKVFNASTCQIINDDIVNPCVSWFAVTCRNGHVIALNLASNGFSGTLSPSIMKLKFLVKLDLQNNDLSGMLPDFLGDMEHLESLNLANNKFSGSIPANWGQLSNLKHLDLSSNNLTGRIPKQLFLVTTINFTGTHLACGSSSEQPCVSTTAVHVSTSRSKIRIVVTSFSCGALIFLSLGAFFMSRYYQVHKRRREVFVDVAGEDDVEISLSQLRRFSWREIQLATDNFNECNKIGQGGFGKVYKGVLRDNSNIAVKRLADYRSPGGEAAFLREVQLISVAVHKNLLRLIGFCTTPSERILVYPFMQNLSVAYQLRDLKPGEKGLDWPMRKRVAAGAAKGLEYLHDHSNPKIIHRDLKAANILLDDNFEAVIGDFGLAKPVDTRMTHVTTQVRGTMGHIAPEYLSTGKSSVKTDVFGYGITLLELVTGQRAMDCSSPEEEVLLDRIKELMTENRINDMVDGNLKDYDPKEVEAIVRVALICTQSAPEDRPTMAEVVKMLEGIGLAERWAEWEELEQARNREFLTFTHQFTWIEDSSVDQESIRFPEADKS